MQSPRKLHFKSYLPDVGTQQDVRNKLGPALIFQRLFHKVTTQHEENDLDLTERKAFEIRPEMIDRLYHLKVSVYEDSSVTPMVVRRSWSICCRMEYKGQKYFVEMYAHRDTIGCFRCVIDGQFYMTKIADYFMDHILKIHKNPILFYTALLDDGYRIQDHPRLLNNAPTLKQLCYFTIYNYKDVLHNFDNLPKALSKNLVDFIKVKQWEDYSYLVWRK